MHELPICRLRYKYMFYQAVFYFLYKNTVSSRKINWHYKVVVTCNFFITKTLLNPNKIFLELGYSCYVWIKSIVIITNWNKQYFLLKLRINLPFDINIIFSIMSMPIVFCGISNAKLGLVIHFIL